MRNLKLTLTYDGTDFSGWQVQPGRTTIQGVLEEVLQEIEGTAVKLYGSGRTDAGVHAIAQVASCRLANPIPLPNLKKAMNCQLPASIRVLTIEEAPEGFHARFSATAKTYEYRINRAETCLPFEARYVFWQPYVLDEDAMITAAPMIEGTHDFASLASNSGEAVESTVRTIYSSQLSKQGDRLTYRVRGSGFLYNMVRNIVGTLIEVGRSNFSGDDIPELLQAKRRSAAGPRVPARGCSW